MAEQVFETYGVATFRDSHQLGCNIMLDVQNVRKYLTLQDRFQHGEQKNVQVRQVWGAGWMFQGYNSSVVEQSVCLV